jgi:hypothetical protein
LGERDETTGKRTTRMTIILCFGKQIMPKAWKNSHPGSKAAGPQAHSRIDTDFIVNIAIILVP